jgi:hypothetical protein
MSGPVRPASRAFREEARAGGAGVIAAPARLPGRAAPAAPAGLSRASGRAFGWVLAHPLLDRLLRGRLWIAVISFALIGIVAMQLWNLKLNSGIGRAIEHEALLQRENAALSIENSGLASGFKAEARAAGAGMVPIPPGDVTFLNSRGQRDVREAARVLRQPLQNTASSLAPPVTSASEAAPSTPTTAGQELPAAQTSPETPAPGSQTSSTPAEAPATGQTEATTAAAGTEQAATAQGGTPTSETGTAAGETGTAEGQTGAATGQTGTATGETGTATGETGTATGQTGTATGGTSTSGQGLDIGGGVTPGTAEQPLREAAGGVPR